MMISMTLRNKDAGIQNKTYSPAITAEELDALTADFISYKRDGVLPDIFGRDASTTTRLPGH